MSTPRNQYPQRSELNARKGSVSIHLCYDTIINKYRRWLYRLFTSIDACFRIKRYDVSSEEKDLILDDGLSYFVKNEPYHKELAKHGAQEEVSTICVYTQDLY